MLQQRDIRYKKEQFTDKGKDTLLNSYTKDKFQSVYYKLQAKGVRPQRRTCRIQLSAGEAPTKRSRPASENSRIQSSSTVLFHQEPGTYCIPLLLSHYYIPSGPWRSNSSKFSTLPRGSGPAIQRSSKAMTTQWRPSIKTTHPYQSPQSFCKAIAACQLNGETRL